MRLNNVSSTNFGMAKIKGGFHKIAVDALVEAHSKNPIFLSAVKGDLHTIGRALDGEVRLQTIGDAAATVYRDRRSLWDVICRRNPWEHLLYPIHKGESPINIVANTADALQRYADLHTKKFPTTSRDIQRTYSEYVDKTNAICGYENSRKKLKISGLKKFIRSLVQTEA